MRSVLHSAICWKIGSRILMHGGTIRLVDVTYGKMIIMVCVCINYDRGSGGECTTSGNSEAYLVCEQIRRQEARRLHYSLERNGTPNNMVLATGDKLTATKISINTICGRDSLYLEHKKYCGTRVSSV